MNVNDTQLLDCGHVGQLGGICQFDGCADQICTQCVTECENCRCILCPVHDVQLDGGRNFCPDHVAGHVATKLANHLFNRYQ